MTEGLLEKKTPEEAALIELAAQEEDRKEAKRRIGEETLALPAPFVSVEYYVGVGPLAYETRRSLIKVLSGDVKAIVEYDLTDEQGVVTKVTDFFIMAKATFEKVFAGRVPVPSNEDLLTKEIGDERRKKAHPTPSPMPAPEKPGPRK